MPYTTDQRMDAYNAVEDVLIKIVHNRAGIHEREIILTIYASDILEISDAAINSLLKKDA